MTREDTYSMVGGGTGLIGGVYYALREKRWVPFLLIIVGGTATGVLTGLFVNAVVPN